MKALALVESPDHVCCRYRIQAYAPALERVGISLETAALARGLVPRALQFARLGRFDTVVLQRKLLLPWQLRLLRRQARLLVFDFDDAVLYRDSYDPRGPHCPRRLRRFSATVQASDVVIAGNDFLADCALRAGAKAERVRVIPTCVDPDRYVLTGEPALKPGLALVWIGSSSTLQGLEAERDLWEAIARAVPGVSLRIIADRGADLGAMPVSTIPWSPDTEARELAIGEVGISLLPDDLWSRGKCGLKVLQYQAAGLPVLANPVGVHAEMIEPGVTGWLPRSPAEWVDRVRTLATDELLRFEMGRAGRASVEAGYSIKVWESTFAAAIAGTTPSSVSTLPALNLRGWYDSAPTGKIGEGPVFKGRRNIGSSSNGAVHHADGSGGVPG